jgi:hypothetical protein
MTIRPVGAELFRPYGQTARRPDVMKIIMAFRNFTNAPRTGPTRFRYVQVSLFKKSYCLTAR